MRRPPAKWMTCCLCGARKPAWSLSFVSWELDEPGPPFWPREPACSACIRDLPPIVRSNDQIWHLVIRQP